MKKYHIILIFLLLLPTAHAQGKITCIPFEQKEINWGIETLNLKEQTDFCIISDAEIVSKSEDVVLERFKRGDYYYYFIKFKSFGSFEFINQKTKEKLTVNVFSLAEKEQKLRLEEELKLCLLNLSNLTKENEDLKYQLTSLQKENERLKEFIDKNLTKRDCIYLDNETYYQVTKQIILESRTETIKKTVIFLVLILLLVILIGYMREYYRRADMK